MLQVKPASNWTDSKNIAVAADADSDVANDLGTDNVSNAYYVTM